MMPAGLAPPRQAQPTRQKQPIKQLLGRSSKKAFKQDTIALLEQIAIRSGADAVMVRLEKKVGDRHVLLHRDSAQHPLRKSSGPVLKIPLELDPPDDNLSFTWGRREFGTDGWVEQSAWQRFSDEERAFCKSVREKAWVSVVLSEAQPGSFFSLRRSQPEHRVVICLTHLRGENDHGQHFCWNQLITAWLDAQAHFSARIQDDIHERFLDCVRALDCTPDTMNFNLHLALLTHLLISPRGLAWDRAWWFRSEGEAKDAEGEAKDAEGEAKDAGKVNFRCIMSRGHLTEPERNVGRDKLHAELGGPQNIHDELLALKQSAEPFWEDDPLFQRSCESEPLEFCLTDTATANQLFKIAQDAASKRVLLFRLDDQQRDGRTELPDDAVMALQDAFHSALQRQFTTLIQDATFQFDKSVYCLPFSVGTDRHLIFLGADRPIGHNWLRMSSLLLEWIGAKVIPSWLAEQAVENMSDQERLALFQGEASDPSCLFATGS